MVEAMKLDMLVFSAHPDDAEISAGGTIAKACSSGKKVGIIDMTKGEFGSRGSASLRLEEAESASKILGLHVRENIGLKDGFFTDDESTKIKLIIAIRKYRPDIVLCNSIHDRHPDHGRAGKIISEACFLSGLRKVLTDLDGVSQQEWRPRSVYHYIQDYFIEPDFVVDITSFFDVKMACIKAFSSQFYDPGSDEPDTPISGPEFFDYLKGRSMQFGRPAGFLYAEGFNVERYPGVNSFWDLV
jgi:bacillithiol biosynthesis deacetylase BshB1